MTNAVLSLDDPTPAAGLTVAQVDRLGRDAVAQPRASRYLHGGPLIVEPVLR